ncbi:MAG TPA: molybdopterin-dependent oxidoreductase [Methanomicrobiales archaeon]|jgi:DMSO/TMAO reductase YedYZ molybdopterin-dependent catalytic subunit|nr:molybdopterin-dependent oxidoreductase [Methanomicrobiales archaeon]
MSNATPGFIFLCITLILMGIFAGCLGAQGPPERLSGVEVRDYQGKPLSSVNDFRENSIAGPQHVNITGYRLTIDGLVNQEKVYTYDQVLGGFPHYEKVVTLSCVEGWDATILWEGVKVSDLIDTAGADPRANTVIFTAVDGYSTSEPLDYLRANRILLAYRMNNITMPAERGYPFELVAEDKWGYKWIKWVTDIRLSDDPTYRGYWESRGYSNLGDLNSSFFGD